MELSTPSRPTRLQEHSSAAQGAPHKSAAREPRHNLQDWDRPPRPLRCQEKIRDLYVPPVMRCEQKVRSPSASSVKAKAAPLPAGCGAKTGVATLRPSLHRRFSGPTKHPAAKAATPARERTPSC